MVPDFLSVGDSIGIVSTARYIPHEELQFSIDFLENLGLQVILGKNLFNINNQFAGTDHDRLSDFQSMLDDTNIKAILCARGGYGSVRILDQINFTKFNKNPKWIIGYSDVTVFHNHINQALGIPTIHASMPISFPSNTQKSLKAFGQTIFGKRLGYSMVSDVRRQGEVKAEIVGGNLSIIYSMMGSISQLETKGKILFIEDIDEMLYHIDRMIMALKRAGMLSNLKGLIVGGMTGMRDNTKEFGFSTDNPFGQSTQEIIWQHVEEFDYPVCFDFPAGHQDNNFPMIMGLEVKVAFETDKIIVKI